MLVVFYVYVSVCVLDRGYSSQSWFRCSNSMPPPLPFPFPPAMSFAYLAQHLLVASAAFVVVEQFMIHCGLWFTFPRHQIAASKTNDWHNSHANDFEISFIHPRTHTHTLPYIPLSVTHTPLAICICIKLEHGTSWPSYRA